MLHRNRNAATTHLAPATTLPEPPATSPPLLAKDHYAVKCAFLGEAGVGKSALLLRYTRGTFSDQTAPTIGIDFALKTLDVNESTCLRLQLWDTAGQEKFHSLVQTYFRSCYLFFIVFDLTKWHTFTCAALWLTQLREHRCHRGGKKRSDECDECDECDVVLIGNMADRSGERAVPTETAQQWASENGIRAYYELSAKNGIGVDKAFQQTAQRILPDLERMVAQRGDEDDAMQGVRFTRAGRDGAQRRALRLREPMDAKRAKSKCCT